MAMVVSSSSPLVVGVGDNVDIARRVKGGWSKEEDHVLRKLVAEHGTTSWALISRSIPGRTGKSCRIRWCNQISPDVEHRPFTSEEDQIVVDGQRELGNRWAAIARRLPGRTENSVKNRWHCSLKRWYASEDHDVAKMMMMKPIQSRMPPLPTTFSRKRKFPEDPADTARDAKMIQPPLRKMRSTPLSSRISTDHTSSNVLQEMRSVVPARPFPTDMDDPMSTILSLELPRYGASPYGDSAHEAAPYPNMTPVMAPPMKYSPVGNDISVMENKIWDLSRELSEMKKQVLSELEQQNRSIKIFGKTLLQGKLVGDQKQSCTHWGQFTYICQK